MTWLRGLAIAAAACAVACPSDGGGCGGEYEYPRTDPDAAPTDKAMRARVTQTGLDAVAEGLAAMLAAACSDPTGDACTVDDPAAPTEAHFYIGKPGEQMSFSALGVTGELRSGGAYPLDREFDTDVPLVSSPIEDRIYCDDTGAAACQAVLARGTGTTAEGFCRAPSDPGCTDPDTDYCCQAAAPHLCAGDYAITSCTAARSTFGIDLESLEGNVHLALVQDAQGGGIQLTLGCNDPDPTAAGACQDVSEYVRGYLDLVVRIALGSAVDDIACFVEDGVDPRDPTELLGFEITSFRFTVRPRIELGADLKPHLVVGPDDVTVDAFELDVNIVGGAALEDPACYDEGWHVTVLPPGVQPSANPYDDCQNGTIFGLNDCNTVGWLSNIVVWLLENGTLGRAMAALIAQVALRSFAEDAVEVSGELDLGTVIPVGARNANPVGYLITANPDSPDITGSGGALGLNFDFDSGFVSEHSHCVPTATPPSFIVPPPPDPGATVEAIDPESCALDPAQPFDLAFLIGDALIGRAAFELFDGGSLCLDLDAGSLASLGFVPTVAALGVFAPGLGDLAPEETPVDLALTPRDDPVILFGTGEGEGQVRDSHIQFLWPHVEVGLYPLVDDTTLRALGFGFDLDLGLSLEPTPAGDLQLMVDRLLLSNVVETYNEGMVGDFDERGFESLVEAFLPKLMTGKPIDVELTSTALGFPFVPKARAAGAVGPDNAFLGLFFRFCTATQIADPDNALCFEDPAGEPPCQKATRNALHTAISLEWLEGPGGDLDNHQLRVRVYADAVTSGDLEVAHRVGVAGPFRSFRRVAADGTFLVEAGILAMPGPHTIEMIARDRRRPGAWSEPAFLLVVSDHAAPAVPARRVPGGVESVLGAGSAVAASGPEADQTGRCDAGTGTLGAALLALVATAGRRRRAPGRGGRGATRYSTGASST